jgi:hypothetical protein
MPAVLAGRARQAHTILMLLEPLLVDFLAWLEPGPRPYAEVMDAWRTSCPRLTVWEDALEAGWIERRAGAIALTPAGREWLVAHRATAE